MESLSLSWLLLLSKTVVAAAFLAHKQSCLLYLLLLLLQLPPKESPRRSNNKQAETTNRHRLFLCTIGDPIVIVAVVMAKGRSRQQLWVAYFSRIRMDSNKTLERSLPNPNRPKWLERNGTEWNYLWTGSLIGYNMDRRMF